jgi:hypothetical protein
MTTTPNTHSSTKTTVPVVRDLRTAAVLAPEFDLVVTAGPNRTEVDWNHPNHHVQTFGDTTIGVRAPTLRQVERLVSWAGSQDGTTLVHCHAGISRSTATAIGIMIARGTAPADAVADLAAAHPRFHPFYPNKLIVAHLETIFGLEPFSLEDTIAPHRVWN